MAFDLKQATLDAEINRNEPAVFCQIMHSIRSYFDKSGKSINRSTVEWFELYAKQGNSSAQYSLGYMYHFGHGITQDYKEALEWYRLSATQGNSYAQSNLGHMYRHGHGIIQDYREAVEWYQLSAVQGNPIGQYNLGYMYYHGLGVTQDYRKAVEWHQLSAKQGDSYAQCNLGYIYYHGHGVIQYYGKAMEWYCMSAAQGNSNGLYNLGCVYRDGLGVTRDYREAHKYYQMSMKNGNPKAKEALIELLKTNVEIFMVIVEETVEENRNHKNEIKGLKEEIEKLEVTVPIEGGPEYQKAKERYDKLKGKQGNTMEEFKSKTVGALDAD